MQPDLSISEVQHLAMTQFDDPQVVRMVFGGGAAGGKSFLIGLLCRNGLQEVPWHPLGTSS
jgi:hypothetical protein